LNHIVKNFLYFVSYGKKDNAVFVITILEYILVKTIFKKVYT